MSVFNCDERVQIIESERDPDKTSLTYEQVFLIYSKLSDIDEMFKEIAQIKILQKVLNEEKVKSIV